MNNQEEPLSSFMLDLEGEYVSWSIKINEQDVKSGSNENGSFMLSVPVNKYLKSGENIIKISVESADGEGSVNVKLYDHGNKDLMLLDSVIPANQSMSTKLRFPEGMRLEKQTSIFDM